MSKAKENHLGEATIKSSLYKCPSGETANEERLTLNSEREPASLDQLTPHLYPKELSDQREHPALAPDQTQERVATSLSHPLPL